LEFGCGERAEFMRRHQLPSAYPFFSPSNSIEREHAVCGKVPYSPIHARLFGELKPSHPNVLGLPPRLRSIGVKTYCLSADRNKIRVIVQKLYALNESGGDIQFIIASRNNVF
jgi:hypothetical protein